MEHSWSTSISTPGFGNTRENLLTFGEQQEFPLVFYIFVKQVIKLFCKRAVITINAQWKAQVMSVEHCWEWAGWVRCSNLWIKSLEFSQCRQTGSSGIYYLS